jgi:hypothetical protein
MQLHIDSLEYGWQIVINFGIPEANDSVALPLEPDLAFMISFGGFIVVVMSPIEFKDEAFGRTEEVHNVRTDRRLAPEMRPVDWKFSQGTPQCAFVRRRVGPQTFSRYSTDRD